MKKLNIIGENVYVNNEFVISEGFLGSIFGGKKGKSAWLGNLISFIPGLAPKEQEEKLDDYQKSMKGWADKWKETRKNDLEKEMKHKMQVRINRYEIDQQRKFNKHQAEQKVKEFRRAQEEEAQKSILAQLKREQARIDNYIMGPSTPEAMATFIEATEKLYANATPAEQKLKDNVSGMMADIYYKDDGKGNLIFLGDEEHKAELAENAKKYRTQFADNPEMLETVNDLISNAPKNETEFNEKFAKVIVNDPDGKSSDELEKDKTAVQNYIDGLSDKEKARKEAAETLKTTEERQKKLKAKKEAADEAKNELDKVKEMNPNQVRDNMYDNITKDDKDTNGKDIPVFIQDGEEEGPDGTMIPKWKVNPKSNKAKLLLDAGYTNDEILNMKEDGNPPVLKTTNLKDSLKEKVSDETCEKVKKAQIKTYQKTIDSFSADDQTQLDADNKALDPDNKEGVQAKFNQAESELTEFTVSNDAERAREIIREYNPKLTGDNISSEDASKTITGINGKLEERTKAMEHLKEVRKMANDEMKKAEKDKEIQDTIKNLTPEQKKELENLPVNIDSVSQKDNDNREYIETDLKDDKGNPIRLYKPSKDSPNYDEEMMKYDQAVSAKLATAELGDRPTVDDPSDFDQIKKQRQWDINNQAKEAAKQKLIDKYKDDKAKDGEKVSDEEATDYVLNMLDDKEFLKDAGDIDGLESEGNGEDENGEDAQLDANDETVTKEKEAQDAVNAAQEAYDNASDEEKEQKKEELEKAKEELKKAQEAKDDKEHKSGVKNPAKIWKRKKKENGHGSTKNYYYVGANAKMKGQSISPAEYKKRLETYKKKKGVKQDKQSFQDNRPVIFEKRKWTTTPLFGNKK